MEAVVKSRILSRTERPGPEGRSYAAVELAAETDFGPGQYLMVRAGKRQVRWPYPYLIHARTERGLVVLTAAEQDLYAGSAGDTVEYWGPRGTAPLDEGERPILAAEPATAFLLLPFLAAGACAELILAAGETAGLLGAENAGITWAGGPEQAAELAGGSAGRIVVALNPENLARFSDALPADKRGEALAFVSNKKACGIGACKGCYLHSGEDVFGVDVCCRGPFLPLSGIDFEADGKCLESYK